MSPSPLCAVEGCPLIGKPHSCPADGGSHGHGMIHYEHCHTSLMFRRPGWHLICDVHFKVCADARIAWEEAQREERKARTISEVE